MEKQSRIKRLMMLEWVWNSKKRRRPTTRCPIPYYGLGHGFDLVLDMVEDAALGLIEEIKKKLRRT
jgi:predicted transcriptional regulator